MKTTPLKGDEQPSGDLMISELLDVCSVLGVSPNDVLRDLYPEALGDSVDADAGVDDSRQSKIEMLRVISRYANLCDSHKREFRRMFELALLECECK